MQLYSLTLEEADALNQLNCQRNNVLLIVCRHGEYIGVDPAALQDPIYADWLAVLGTVNGNPISPFDTTKIVNVEAAEPF